MRNESRGIRPLHKKEMDMGARVGSKGTQHVHGEETDNVARIESGRV
jgi:hypothetical protein